MKRSATDFLTRISAGLLLLFLPAVLPAQLLQLRLVSSAYGWQQQDSVGQSATHLFGYQTAQLALSGEHYSVHTYLQGFNDFAGPVKNSQARIRVYNLYGRVTDDDGMIDVSLGRMPIFAGVGMGTIDGASVAVRALDARLKVLGYYGSLPPVNYSLKTTENASDNTMLGARVTADPVDFGEVSVSYVRKYMRPETYMPVRRDTPNYNPYVTEFRPGIMAEQLLGGEVSGNYGTLASATVRYDYDLNQEQTDRFQIFSRVKIMERLSAVADYMYRQPRLSYNSIFWVFTSTTLSEFEGGLEYALDNTWQVFGRYGGVSYGGDDRSDRVTVGINGKYVSASAAWSTGYAGELKACSFNASYPLMNNTLTPTLQASYALYQLDKRFWENAAFSAAAGAVYRPIPLLSIDGQVQFVTNKIYADDLRFLVRVSYLLSERLNIF